MATQTGECRIDTIEGTKLSGWFRSLYDRKLGPPNASWGAMFLYDAFRKRAGIERDEATLRQAVDGVVFATPDGEESTFELYVTDAAVLEGLSPGSWDSYYLG